MNLEENLNKILSKHDELQKKATSDEIINSPKDYAIISKELSEILPTVELIKKFKKIKKEIEDSNIIIEDIDIYSEIVSYGEFRGCALPYNQHFCFLAKPKQNFVFLLDHLKVLHNVPNHRDVTLHFLRLEHFFPLI